MGHQGIDNQLSQSTYYKAGGQDGTAGLTGNGRDWGDCGQEGSKGDVASSFSHCHRVQQQQQQLHSIAAKEPAKKLFYILNSPSIEAQKR